MDWTYGMKPFLSNLALVTLGIGIVTAPMSPSAQSRPTPRPAPNYTPAPPPSIGEVTPFPSNTDREIALVAHLFDPKENRLIVAIDSQSNQTFVLQISEDLINWQDTEEVKQGNKSIITFVVPIQAAQPIAYFRVKKR